MTRVWIKLYIDKDQEPSVFTLFGVNDFNGNIDQLKEKVQEMAQRFYLDIDADRFDVYPQGTAVPILDGATKCPLSKPPPNNTEPDPLIAVAQERQQLNGLHVIRNSHANEQGTKRKVFELDMDNRDRKKRRFWKASRKPLALPAKGTTWYQARTEKSDLFVRECTQKCFTEIWETVEKKKVEWVEDTKRHAVFIVTGPPGLGKSWSSNVIVWQLLKKRQNMWFHSASDHTLTTFEFGGKDSDLKVTDFPEYDVLANKPPEGTWFLYDAIGGSSGEGEMISFQQQGVCVPCAIFSSPKEENYKQGIKDMESGLVRYLWMPSWEWQELKAVMSSFHEEHGGKKTLEEFEEFFLGVFKLWGGIPRRLIKYCEKFRDGGVETALQQCQNDFESQLNTLSEAIISLGPTIVHRMYTVSTEGETGSFSAQVPPPSWLVVPAPINSEKLYEEKTYKFCSQEAEVEFLKILASKDTDAVRRFCMAVFEVPGAVGIAFERFAHFLLTRTESNTFRWKQYVSDKQEDSENHEVSVVLPKCTSRKCEMEEDLRLFQEEIERCIREDKCVVIDPTCDDQEDAIDMFVVCKLDGRWQVLAMQDTISKTHSFHPVKILEYRQAAKKAFLAVKQEAGDDFFLHVVVAPAEKKWKPFRLQGARMARLNKFDDVLAKFKEIDLSTPAELSDWNVTKTKQVCRDAKVKGWSQMKGEIVKATGAEALLLKAADAKVRGLTWVIDGFFNRARS